MIQKKLALAVATVLVGSPMLAQAQVDLDAPTVKPTVWASEIRKDDATPNLPTGGTGEAGALSVKAKLGFGFAKGDKRYARLDLDNGAKFKIGSKLECSLGRDGGAGTATCERRTNVGGNGTSFAVFTLDAAGQTNDITSGQTIEFWFTAVNDGVTVSGSNTVSVTYTLHNSDYSADALLTAAASTPLYKKTAEYITYKPILKMSGTAQIPVTADVGEGFKKFVNATTRGLIGMVSFEATGNLPSPALAAYPLLFDTTTTPSPQNKARNLTDMLSAAKLVVTGDFTATQDFSGTTGLDTYVTAGNRVYLSNSPSCASKDIVATTVAAAEASFTLPASAGNASQKYLCIEVNGVTPMNPSLYSAAFSFTAKTGYTVSGQSFDNIGEVKQNGAVIDTPYVTLTSGYISRVMLMNTSSAAVKYTASVITDSGATVTLGAAATGEIPAKANLQINVSDLVAFSGKPRGAVRFVVSAPNQTVQGVYQTVNLGTGDTQSIVLNRRGGGSGL